MVELYSRRSFLAGVLTAGMLSTSAGYFLTRREKITLSLATGADPTGGRQLLVSMWNRLNPNTQIAVSEVNSSTQDQFLKFMKEQKPEARALLAKEKKMTDEVVKQLDAAIAAFGPQFKG